MFIDSDLPEKFFQMYGLKAPAKVKSNNHSWLTVCRPSDHALHLKKFEIEIEKILEKLILLSALNAMPFVSTPNKEVTYTFITNQFVTTMILKCFFKKYK